MTLEKMFEAISELNSGEVDSHLYCLHTHYYLLAFSIWKTNQSHTKSALFFLDNGEVTLKEEGEYKSHELEHMSDIILNVVKDFDEKWREQ